MQPLGCFGSSLAFAPTSSICGGCTARDDCASLVDGRRPLMMRLLERFNDAQGKPMSLPWMTKEERKRHRAAEKALELADAAEGTFGDADAVMALKTHLDARAHPSIDRFVRMRINPKIATLEVVGGVSKCMAVVIAALRDRPHTMRELVARVAAQPSVSASSAQRDTYATVSILTVCERVKRSGKILELA